MKSCLIYKAADMEGATHSHTSVLVPPLSSPVLLPAHTPVCVFLYRYSLHVLEMNIVLPVTLSFFDVDPHICTVLC